jgi:hypothetical protein
VPWLLKFAPVRGRHHGADLLFAEIHAYDFGRGGKTKKWPSYTASRVKKALTRNS